jgi:hypothetical protein
MKPLSSSSSLPSSSLVASPLVKRVLYDYQPAISPTSIYAVLSLQGAASPPEAASGAMKTMSYLQQQIEPKITCLALLCSLSACSPSSSHESGLLVFGGLDTGELVEWICYPSHSSDTSPLKGSQDTEVCTAPMPLFVQSVYSLPGLSSDDMKIYSDQSVSFSSDDSRSQPPPPPPLSQGSTSTLDGLSSEQRAPRRLSTRDLYLKKHKKLFANKKIRDIVTSSSAEASSGGTRDSTLICLAASDGAISLMRSRPRSLDLPAGGGGVSSSRECQWYEHLGRVNVHEGDAYTIAMDPLSSYVVSGGFDCSVSILDLASLTVIRRYKEHQASITQVGCNRSVLASLLLSPLSLSLPLSQNR